MKNNAKELRQKIIEFVKSRGGQTSRAEIKAYLGYDDWTYHSFLEKAFKTKKLIPIYGSGHIGSGLFVSRKPVIGYKLA